MSGCLLHESDVFLMTGCFLHELDCLVQSFRFDNANGPTANFISEECFDFSILGVRCFFFSVCGAR